MTKQRIDTGKAPQILVDACNGDLIVRGWSEPAVEWKGEYQVAESEKGYRFSGSGNLRLSLPAGSSLWVESVSGDAILKQMDGDCLIDTVHGDVVLVALGSFQANTVHGDLVSRGDVSALNLGEVHGDISARNTGGITLRAVRGDFVSRRADGAVAIEEASGDVVLRYVTDNVTIGHAHRDVNVAYADGIVNLSNVEGDVRLRGPLGEGDHRLTARGDIVVRWPSGAPLNLTATGRRVDNRLPLEDAVAKNGSLSGRIGTGGASLALNAGGRVILKEAEMVNEKWSRYDGDESEFEFDMTMNGVDLAAIGARIESEINSHVARITREIETHFGPEFGQRIGEKMSRQAERAGERARRKMETRGRMGGFDAPPPPPPARKAASSEEQLKILKMVETGTISPEEAGMLLEALDS